MGPLTDDPAPVEDDYPVGVHDRADPLGDDYPGGPAGLPVQGLPQVPVGAVVKGGEGVVEDVDVRAPAHGAGYGKALLKRLVQIAVERGCGRLEWWCLDWNRPSIDFYLAMGAEPMSDWTVYRVAGEALADLAR